MTDLGPGIAWEVWVVKGSPSQSLTRRKKIFSDVFVGPRLILPQAQGAPSPHPLQVSNNRRSQKTTPPRGCWVGGAGGHRAPEAASARSGRDRRGQRAGPVAAGPVSQGCAWRPWPWAGRSWGGGAVPRLVCIAPSFVPLNPVLKHLSGRLAPHWERLCGIRSAGSEVVM